MRTLRGQTRSLLSRWRHTAAWTVICLGAAAFIEGVNRGLGLVALGGAIVGLLGTVLMIGAILDDLNRRSNR